ncbi:MAG: hypothetical protein C0392_13425 [Syntrophus sp. (in: bacteria)]|nr:hypothetical protein [Syntrophus sp. (in: bacteria)]
MGKNMIDVVVVGAGPGGCMAAKKCVEGGLNTVLVEKKRLPRDKVCTGMIMAPWAQDLVREEFGEIPIGVLVEPYNAVALHVGREHSVRVPTHIPVGWRKNLDYWMCRKAVEAGVVVRDNAKVTGIVDHETHYEVEFEKDGRIEEIDCRFVIGADGAISEVRRSIYPDLNSQPRTAVRECYEVPLSIRRDDFHWFFPFAAPSPRFDVNYKEGFFLVEGGGIKAIRAEMMEILAEFGMPSDARPIWRDACAIPVLYDVLFKGSFVPAKGNVMLVGDAGGLLVPFTQEGIGSALKSGFLAAESILEAIQGNGKTEGIYINKVQGMIGGLKHLWFMQQGLSETAKKGVKALCDAMGELVEETLKEHPSSNPL